MKITCDKCSAKYSIADDKVKGKSFRLKCQKCGHSIVVKADQAAAGSRGLDSSGGTASDSDPDGWHIAIGQDQIGPLSFEEIESRWRRKEINADSFAWKEGMPDWKQLKDVGAFSELLGDVGATEVGSYGGDFSASDDEATRVASRSGLDLASGGLSSAELGAGAQKDASVATKGDDEPLVTIDASVRESSPSIATGLGAGVGLSKTEPVKNIPKASTGFGSSSVDKRSENSVLFSLSDIKQGGQSAGADSGRSLGGGSLGGGQTPTGGSNSEDSGLLDIRAMASTLGSSSSTRNRSGSRASIELPSVGSVNSSFAPIAAAPILMPNQTVSGKPKWLLPVLLGIGALFIFGGVFAFMKMGAKSKEPASIASVDSGDINKGSDGAAAEVAESASGEDIDEKLADVDDKLTDDTGSEKLAAAPPTDDIDDKAARVEPAATKAPRATSGRRKPPRRAPRRRPTARPTKTERPAPVAAKPRPVASKPSKPARKRDEIDDLISGATGGGRPTRSKPSTSAGNLPSTLSRSQVKSGMSRVSGKVRSCYDKFKVPGMASVRVKISGSSGRVASAKVGGKFGGTPTGACVSRAVSTARFPKFSSPTMTVTYPFILK